ncbi:aspartate carbamoyltransferase regulatory subunit, partial [Neisseria sicca]
METPKLSVEAIEKGTVIDHIPAGKGLIILRQFKLLHYGSAVTVGFNLPSKTQGSKDIIKITGVWLDDNAANRLALFAPEAVVNTIDHFKVINKRRLTLPDEIAEVFRCPNTNCASHGEPVKSRFYVRKQSGQTKLKCHYCEKTFSRDS